jgi:PEP-CTERM motif
MNPLSAGMLRWRKECLLAALATPFLMMGQAAHSQVDFGAMNLSATAHEALLPGATIFDDGSSLADAAPGDHTEFLYHASQGENLSGRSTTITSAFASALAAFNHTGGVGVTSWIGADPSPTNPDAIEQLAAHATWTQDFANNTAEPNTLFAILHIPALQVGLIGVPPDRSSVSATETAEAEVTVAFIVTHADGTTTKGPLFEFGLRAFERQFLLAPGHFENFADVEFLGVNDKTLPLFDSFKDNGDAFNPRFDIDAVSTKVDFGTLQPGDTLDVVYQLTAVGTTGGGEEGFVAFLGDPFEVSGGADAFVVTAEPAAAAVPEPATWVLMILGIGGFVGFGRRRRAWAPYMT